MNNPTVMNTTIGYLLCCQSPALFLAALVLILRHFARRKNHRVRAAADLVLGILCAVAGVALYFLGIGWGHFTIGDFYRIRGVGWVGLGLVALLTLYGLFRAAQRSSARRAAEKERIRTENEQEFARRAAEEEARRAVEEQQRAAAEEQQATAAAVAAEVERAVEQEGEPSAPQQP